jgi:hypothetical protein
MTQFPSAGAVTPPGNVRTLNMLTGWRDFTNVLAHDLPTQLLAARLSIDAIFPMVIVHKTGRRRG